jgi:AraC-like DNA-binding protein
MNVNLAFHKVDDSAKKVTFECVVGQGVLHEFPFHVHHSLCIGLVTGGVRRITFPDSDVCVQAGELFVVNPLQSHAIRQPYPHDYVAITVKGLFGCPFVFNRHIRSVECKRLFVNLSDAIQNQEDAFAHWDSLFDYLCRYQRDETRPAGTDAIMERTAAYIAANYQNPVTVSDLAEHNRMSVFHYCRMFKSLTGISPHRYLMQYRLSVSRHCLQEKEMVFDTAINAGFYDSSHFIRNFYSNMAVSPKSYRQSILKNSKNIQRETENAE